METYPLNATVRAGTGKGIARKVRASGRTPGVVYSSSSGAIAAVDFDVADLAAAFRKTNDPNTLFDVTVGAETHLCLVREIQRHPVTRDVLHLDLYSVSADQLVVANVTVNPVGRAAGTRSGGTMRLLARTLTMSVPAGSIPKTVDVDVTPLDVGQFLKASQVPAPAGAKFLFKQDFNVVAVEGKRAKEEAAPAAPEKKGK